MSAAGPAVSPPEPLAGKTRAGNVAKPVRAGRTLVTGSKDKGANATGRKTPKRSRRRDSVESEPLLATTPVVIQATPTQIVVSLPDAASTTARRKKGGGKPGKRPMARRPARQTFLVAATLDDGDGAARLGVYAVVTRSPAEALAAVRDLLGPDVPAGFTGKLSRRMAKALGLKPGEVRRI